MNRPLSRLLKGMPATDGAGVELTRVIGQPMLDMFDPFLLLDVFRSSNPDDYIAGFPAHPHRGFETVTYLLNGRMRHRDNAGHEGVIEAGGIQWMTAARGIVHSEMPEQEAGLLEGFQLWVNLPAANKMDTPAYQEFPRDQIPLEQREGARVRVITGITSLGTRGPVVQPLTNPLFLDVELQAGQSFKEKIDSQNNAFVYGIQGETRIADKQNNIQKITRDWLALLGPGENIELSAGDRGCRFLVLSGKPLNEPVARGGPFVMNTQQEIHQAINDYQSGKF